MDKKKAIRVLKHLKRTFEKHNIEYWLDYGTLLGAVREGKFISWDKDIDISVWYKDAAKISYARKFFNESNIEFEIYWTGSHYGVRDAKTKEHYICLLFTVIYGDYCFNGYTVAPMRNIIQMLTTSKMFKDMPYETKEKLIGFSWAIVNRFHLYRPGGLRCSPRRHVEKLSTISFYDEEFKIPSDVETYLVWLYGDNWQIPDKNGRPYKRFPSDMYSPLKRLAMKLSIKKKTR